MTLESFITILVMSATASSVAVEMIKTLLNKAGISYRTMFVAVITAFLVGAAEMMTYTISREMEITTMTILYAVCMGIANTIGATVGYDTVTDFINALFGRTT